MNGMVLNEGVYWNNDSLYNLYCTIDGVEYEEEWVSISEYNGIYMISSFGRIKSLMRDIKILKPFITKKNYLRVCLSKSGTKRNHSIHQLVALHYIDNKFNYKGVHHLNYNKQDNRKWNLEWKDDIDNIKDAWAKNKVPYQIGVDASNSTFSKEQVLDIYYSELSVSQLSEKYNRPYSTIYGIKAARIYKEITNGVSRIKNKSPRLTEEDIKMVLNSNLAQSKLAIKTGFSISKIKNIKFKYNGKY